MSNTNPPSLFSPRRVHTQPDQDTSLSPSPQRANQPVHPSSIFTPKHQQPHNMFQAKNRKLLMNSVTDPNKKPVMARASSLLQQVAKNPHSWKRNVRTERESPSKPNDLPPSRENTKSEKKSRPHSLADHKIPVKVGTVEYLVRMFDGQLCQEKEEPESPVLYPAFTSEKSSGRNVNPVTKDPRDSKRNSCKAPMPSLLRSFDMKRVTDLKKFLNESGLASPGKFMKAKLARNQTLRDNENALSELSFRGKAPGKPEEWRDPSKLRIDNTVSIKSMGTSTTQNNIKPASTPRSEKVPRIRIPYFPRNKVLPPSRQSRSHSPILHDYSQNAKQRLGIVGQSLNTLRGLRRQIVPRHNRTLDVALQTQVFQSIENLVLKSLSSDSDHQQDVEEEQSENREQITHQISEIDLEELGSHRRVATEPEPDSTVQFSILPRVTVKPLSEFTPNISELRKVVQPNQILNTSRLIALTRRTNLKLRNYENQKLLESGRRPGTTQSPLSFNAYFRNLRMFSSTKLDSPSSLNSSYTNTSTPTSVRESKQRRLIPSLFSSTQQSPRRITKRLASIVQPPESGLFPYD